MRADCILIDGDPLADLEALDRVTLVIKDGRISFAAPTTNSAELI
jgi:imidazolonepropionase-like amidohydrolase